MGCLGTQGFKVWPCGAEGSGSKVDVPEGSPELHRFSRRGSLWPRPIMSCRIHGWRLHTSVNNLKLTAVGENYKSEGPGYP